MTTLNVTGLKRVFVYKKDGQSLKLNDPDPTIDPQGVLDFYSNLYPELTTGRVGGAEFKGNTVLYEFSASFGAKG